MKKLLSFTLTLALLLTTIALAVVPASAQPCDTTITVGGSTYVADVGNTFTYTALVKCDKAVTAGQIELPVDFSILSGEDDATMNRYIDEIMPVVGDAGLVQRFDTPSRTGLVGYVFNFATDNSFDFSANTVVFSVQFKVIKAGAVTLNPILREFLDEDCDAIVDLNGETVSGTISLTEEVSLAKQNTYAAKAPLITSFGCYANGLRVNWSTSEGAAKYRVFRKDDAGKWATLDTVTTAYYLDKNVESGVTYTYTVRALDADNHVVSAYSTAGWKGTYVAQPAISSFNSLAGGLQLGWNGVNGAAGYRIFRKDANNKWQMVADVDGLTYTDTNVTPGTQYAYTIRCLNNRGVLVSSYNTTGFTSYYLGAPVLTSVTGGYGCVTVKWAAMNGAEKYRVFRKNLDEDTGWFKIADTTAVSYNDKVVDSDSNYAYTVRCLSADAKKYTSVADPVGLQIHYYAAPAITKFQNIAGGTTITWGAVNGVGNHRLFRKEGTGGWKKIADTTATTYTDKNVKTGVTYSYTVRSLTDDGTAFLSAYNTTGWKNTYLDAPTVTSVGNYVGYVRVNWAKMTGAAKFAVFRKEGTGGWTKLGTTTGVYWNDKTAVSGKTYRYTARCISADGKTYTSAFNNGLAIKYIAAPTIKSVAKVTGGVKVTWAKSAGAVKYRVFRKVGTGGWTKLVDTTALTWTDKKVTKGVKYTYTVRCISADGKTNTSAYNTTGVAITYK